LHAKDSKANVYQAMDVHFENEQCTVALETNLDDVTKLTSFKTLHL